MNERRAIAKKSSLISQHETPPRTLAEHGGAGAVRKSDHPTKVHLVGLAVLDIPLPVKEPVGDLVLTGVLEKSKDEITNHPQKTIFPTCMMVISFSVSSSVSSPALLVRGMSAFFRTMLAYLRPIPWAGKLQRGKTLCSNRASSGEITMESTNTFSRGYFK